ncbi:MAG: hypothetical protein GC155_05740 [Alphaproteobacteria bacterium]|nr:hypothetical protein [Alphaproteobacteria bacterium]
MTFEPPVLEDAFVRLEPLEERHRNPLRAACADLDLWCHHPTNHMGVAFGRWLVHYVETSARGADQSWAVFDKPSGRYAGSTSYLLASNIPRAVPEG